MDRHVVVAHTVPFEQGSGHGDASWRSIMPARQRLSRRDNSAMRKDEVARGPRGRVILIDSITQLAAGDEGAIVVSGSHGGASSGTCGSGTALTELALTVISPALPCYPCPARQLFLCLSVKLPSAG
jgi:hypothetical protein